jgi:hypothetical protein
MYKAAAAFAVALVITGHPASAQLSVGLVAGGTSASTSSDGIGRSPISSVTGFAGGLSLTAPLSTSISLAPEILFAMKGTTDQLSVNSTGIVPHETGTSRISYVEVPVLLRATFGSGVIRPFVTVGPEIAFMTGCSFTIAGTDPSANGKSACSQGTPFTESGVRSTDAGAIVGAGLASGRWSVSLRYDIDFTNSSQDTYGGYARNRTLMAVFGVTP